jgi:hypothetical protein
MNKEIEQLANKNECLFFFNKYEGRENKVYLVKDNDTLGTWFRPMISFIKDDYPKFTELKKFIRNKGTKFYTSCSDYDDKVYGYYFSKDTNIDFEPLDYISKRDLGHTCLFYRDKETKTYKEV